MLFGEYLLLHRKEQNLSANDLAERCGVGRSYITLIETGKRLPGKKLLGKIATVLNIEESTVIKWYLEEIKLKLVKKAS